MLEKVMQKGGKMMPNGAKMEAKITPKSEKWRKKGMPKTMLKFEAEKNRNKCFLNQSWLTLGSIFGGVGGRGEARN